jgi:transcriptional regulator with XRE-family HTH domain
MIPAGRCQEQIRRLLLDGGHAPTAYQLRQITGVSESHGAAILKGTGPKSLRFGTVKQIAEGFGVSVSELLGESYAGEVRIPVTDRERDVLAAVASVRRIAIDALLRLVVEDYVREHERRASVRRILDGLAEGRSEEEAGEAP